MHSTKEAYLAKLQARLSVANAELDKLEARARTAKADQKIRYQLQLGELRDRRDEARRIFAEAKSATGEAWEHLRQGADEAWQRLERAGAKALEAYR